MLRHFDKKILKHLIIFSNRFLFTIKGNLLTKPNPRLFLRAYLGCSLKPVAQNYQIIAIFFYLFIAILRVKISSVNRAFNFFV